VLQWLLAPIWLWLHTFYWCWPPACIRFLCETSPCMCTLCARQLIACLCTAIHSSVHYQLSASLIRSGCICGVTQSSKTQLRERVCVPHPILNRHKDDSWLPYPSPCPALMARATSTWCRYAVTCITAASHCRANAILTLTAHKLWAFAGTSKWSGALTGGGKGS
jgi:hypothetical protein